jgi:hypothetical protein
MLLRTLRMACTFMKKFSTHMSTHTKATKQVIAAVTHVARMWRSPIQIPAEDRLPLLRSLVTLQHNYTNMGIIA